MDEGQTTPPIMEAPAPALRRDSRVERTAASLPAAGVVARVHTAGSIWTLRRTRIVAAAAILLGTAYIVFTMFAPGVADSTALPWSASAQGQEDGGRPGGTGDDRSPASLVDLDHDAPSDTDGSDDRDSDDKTPGDKSSDDKKSPSREADPSQPGSAVPGTTTPGGSNPGTTPTNPGTTPTNPGTTPTNPGTTPTNPGTTPTNPGTTPTTPTTPSVPPPPPPPPPAPKPLAFGSLQENYTSLLGIKLLSSYTLTLSGQPNATASVKYGSTNAGTVTFNSAGQASIGFGSSLINLGLSNPLIRVSYSDGTAGAAIEGYRDSL